MKGVQGPGSCITGSRVSEKTVRTGCKESYAFLKMFPGFMTVLIVSSIHGRQAAPGDHLVSFRTECHPRLRGSGAG